MTKEELSRIVNLNTIREELNGLLQATIRSISYDEENLKYESRQLPEAFYVKLSTVTKPEFARILREEVDRLDKEIEKL